MLWVATIGGLLVLIGKAVVAKDAETPTTSDCQNSPHRRSKAEAERLRNEHRN